MLQDWSLFVMLAILNWLVQCLIKSTISWSTEWYKFLIIENGFHGFPLFYCIMKHLGLFFCKNKVSECKTNTIHVPILMYQMCISTNKVSSVMIRQKKLKITPKNCEDWKNPKSVLKSNQIRRRIELCMREIMLPFDMNL
jgi:hypothetical protein